MCVTPVDVPSIVREQRTAQDAAVEQQRRLRASNDSAIKLNHVVHHGALGHHVQNDYAIAKRVAHRPGGGGGWRQSHRHVRGGNAGGGVGVLRLRPGRGGRIPAPLDRPRPSSTRV